MQVPPGSWSTFPSRWFPSASTRTVRTCCSPTRQWKVPAEKMERYVAWLLLFCIVYVCVSVCSIFLSLLGKNYLYNYDRRGLVIACVTLSVNLSKLVCFHCGVMLSQYSLSLLCVILLVFTCLCSYIFPRIMAKLGSWSCQVCPVMTGEEHVLVC